MLQHTQLGQLGPLQIIEEYHTNYVLVKGFLFYFEFLAQIEVVKGSSMYQNTQNESQMSIIYATW